MPILCSLITDKPKKIEIRLVPELPKNNLPDKLYKKINNEIRIIAKYNIFGCFKNK